MSGTIHEHRAPITNIYNKKDFNRFSKTDSEWQRGKKFTDKDLQRKEEIDKCGDRLSLTEMEKRLAEIAPI
jgi:hypothetical protein